MLGCGDNSAPFMCEELIPHRINIFYASCKIFCRILVPRTLEELLSISVIFVIVHIKGNIFFSFNLLQIEENGRQERENAKGSPEGNRIPL